MWAKITIVLCQSALTVASAQMLSPQALADDVCAGHELLSKPRSESSCLNVRPPVYPSPDGALRALVFPADVSLDATPDMESRVVIRTGDGKLLTSKDYSSPRGMNGYYVATAKWSPDSQFFVYSMMSSGGHSPWQFPMWVYSRQKNLFADFSAMIGNNPTVSADFKFTGPHTVSATTWQGPLPSGAKTGIVERPVSVDLEDTINKIAHAPE